MSEPGTVSFIRSLCMGVIEEEVLFPYPRIPEEQQELLAGVVTALEDLLGPRAEDFRRWDRAGEIPPEFIQELRDFGLFSLVVPEEHGGMGFGAMAYARSIQELARYDGSVAITIGAHSSIGMRGLLLFGTDVQRERWLPTLATGELIAAFCLTEPGAGSDAASIKTTAVRDGDHWVLNGSKLWITNGGMADFFTVFARTDSDRGKMTAFVVTRDLGGVSHGPHEDKMGLRASSTTTVNFDDVRVPIDHVLGEEGKGFKVAMGILNSGRTGLGGGSVGVMKRVIALSTKQAKEREQFGRPIAEYGLIKQKLGHMVVECYASEAVVDVVGGLIDRGGEDYAIEAAISKVFATECLWRTADEGLQIAGGNGFMCEFPYERILRDVRVNRIFEGTNEILRLFIALSALKDVGGELRELSSSVEGVFNDPIKGFGVLSSYALKHMSLRSGISPATGKLVGVEPILRPQADAFEASTRELASAADRILRKHGKNIIGKQFATKRLADIMIDLFALACVISRVDTSVKANGAEAAGKEIEILHVFAGQARRRIRGNFNKIDDNDDELIKSLADHALGAEGFSWDSI